MHSIIEIEGLSYRYGKETSAALSDINLSVAENEILGLVGPNGAGKSTLITIMEGLLLDYQGSVRILNGKEIRESFREVQSKMGVLFQSNGHFDNLNVRETLLLFSQMYKNPVDVHETLACIDADDLSNKKIKNLSGGQRQRFGIALSLINRPRILFYDEPTTGLDPDARFSLWEMIRSLSGKATVVLCSHYMEEISELCDRVCFISKGRILEIGTPQELVDSSGVPTRITFAGAIDEIAANMDGVFVERMNMSQGQILTTHPDEVLRRLYKLQEAGISALSIHIDKPTLDAAYRSITGGERG